MNKIMLFVLILLPLASNAQHWSWAKGASGSSKNAVTSSITDASGNIYVAGRFTDPSITFGTTTLTNISGSAQQDMFLVKYDSDGNVIWAKNYGGGTNQYVAPLVAIDKSGNLYLTGTFSSTSVTFGPTVLFNTGGINRTEMFLVKLDTAGTILWANGVGGQSVMEINAITTDNAGNIFVTGDFIGSSSIIFETDTITHTGNGAYQQLFFAKYKGDGTVQWAKTCTGINPGWTMGESVTIGRNGNTYLTGGFAGPSIIFGADTLINTDSSSHDIFLVEYDSLGHIIWAKSYGGSYEDYGFSTNTDSSGNFYLYGEFSNSTLTFGATTLSAGCCYYMFVARLDSAGNALWAKSVNRNYVLTPSAFSDNSGNFYLGGQYNGPPVSFDAFTVANNGYYNIYVVKYNAVGNAEWAIGADSGGSQFMTSIVGDFHGNIYAAGYFSSPTISLGGTTITNYSTSQNMFFAKLTTIVVHYSPRFLNGHVQSLTLCENAAPFSIDTLLAARDSNMGTVVSWGTLLGPTHGTLTASYSTMSSGGSLIPAGLTYAPTAGCSGNDSFKISISDGVTSDTTMIYITIDSLPVVSRITGLSSVCVGSTISLTDSTFGGIWNSSNPHRSSVDSSGIVIGISAGTTVISYSLVGTCAPDYVVDTIHVFQIPVVAMLSGANIVCVGETTAFTDSVTSGTWASYNACASISGGVVSGVLPGIDTISYTVTNMCGSDSELKTVMVNATPFVDSILGPSSVTVGFGITLNDSTAGGVWFSCDTSIATVDSSGNLLAIVPGTCTIGYAITNSCGADTAKASILVSPRSYMPVTVTYPNPSSGTFTLKIPSDFDEAVQIRIVSVTGGLVRRFETATNTSSSVSLESGVFFLHILSDHVSGVSRVIIDK